MTKKDKALAAAQKFLERGQFEKALAEFARVVQEDPKDTRTWLKMAEIYARRGATDQARDIYLRTGEIYAEQGFLQKAVAVYKNVIKLAPTLAIGHLRLGDVYQQMDNVADALQHLELGAALLQKTGRTADALPVLRQIVALHPENVISRIKLAESASQAGALDEAVREFANAADQLKAQGRSDEYVRVAERLLFHKPDNFPVARELSAVYIARGNPRLALAKLQVPLKAAPRDPENIELLARALEPLDAPKAVSVWRELAEIHDQSGRIAERDDALGAALAGSPRDPELLALAHRWGLSPSQSGRPPATSAQTPIARPLRGPPAAVGPAVPPPGGGAAPGSAGGRGPSSMPGPSSSSSYSSPGASGASRLPPPVPPAARSGVRPPPLPPATAVTGVSGLSVPPGVVRRHSGSFSALLTPRADQDVARILSEAEVFVKYGLYQRAVDHLRRIFEHQPDHRAAREKLAAALAQLGRRTEAAQELATIAESLSAGQPGAARAVAERALALDPTSGRAAALLGRAPAAPAPSAPANKDDDDDVITNQVTPPPVDTERAFLGVDLDAELEQVDFFLEQSLPDEARGLLEDLRKRLGPHPRIVAKLKAVDRASSARAPEAGASPEVEPEHTLPDRLGAVPSDGSQMDGGARGGGAPVAVAADGEPVDLSTHGDLGIAYKEMGLYDAAIAEFKQLTGDPARQVFALTMVGECLEARGSLTDAVVSYKDALNRPAVTPAETLLLYYQLGTVFERLGDHNEALYFFEKVAKKDARFRDVAAKITTLKPQSVRHA